MTLLHCDSFEGYDPANTQETLGRVFSISGTSNGATIETSGARTGSQFMRTEWQKYASLYFPSTLPNARIYVGFAYKSSALATGQAVMYFHSSKNLEANIAINAKKLIVQRYNNVTLATGTKVLSENTWYYIEVKMTITNSTSFGDVIVRVNEVTDIEMGSGFDTCFDTAEMAGISFAGYVNQPNDFDDLYVCSDQGTVNNTFLGDCVVECIRPNGNGATSQWDGSDGNQIDNYLLVDEAALDDSDYVEAQNVNEVDLFEYQNLSIGALVVHGIRVVSAVGKVALGNRRVKQICRSNGSNYEGSEQTLPSSSHYMLSQLWETDPDTGVLWQEGAIGNVQLGVKVSV